MSPDHIPDDLMGEASRDNLTEHNVGVPPIECEGCHDRAHRIHAADMRPVHRDAAHYDDLEGSGLVLVYPQPDDYPYNAVLNEWHAHNGVEDCADYARWS